MQFWRSFCFLTNATSSVDSSIPDDWGPERRVGWLNSHALSLNLHGQTDLSNIHQLVMSLCVLWSESHGRWKFQYSEINLRHQGWGFHQLEHAMMAEYSIKTFPYLQCRRPSLLHFDLQPVTTRICYLLRASGNKKFHFVYSKGHFAHEANY